MNKLKLLSNLIIIPCALLFLGGCATLSYVGNDYQETNVQTVKTQEDFIFAYNIKKYVLAKIGA